MFFCWIWDLQIFCMIKKSYFLITFNVTIVICFHSENVTDLMACGSPFRQASVSILHVSVIFWICLCFWHEKIFQAHLVLCHPLELAISPRILVSSSGRWYLEAKIWALGAHMAHMAIGLFPALAVDMCMHTHTYTHLHLFFLYLLKTISSHQYMEF